MGLKFKKEFENGVSADETYARIMNINGNKDNIEIMLSIFFNKEARNNNKNYVELLRYNFVPSVEDTALNFIKQGYEHLKTLDEYKDAVDVLDEGQTI